MKIVHVINSLATGGAERMVVELATHGERRGHDVLIVVLVDADGLPRRVASERGLRVVEAGASLRDPRLIHRLRRLAVGADIIHVHLFPAMYWGAMLPGPKVFTEHSTHNRRMNKAIFRIPERLVYNRFDRVVAIGSGVASRVRTHASQIGSSTAISVAQNGVADEFFIERSRSKSPAQRLISIGSLTDVKQHSIAIDALISLPGATLDIAGEGPLRAALESQISERGLGDRVRLIGNVADVPALLANYDLLVSTSKHEGFSLVAAEAQASGLPVVGPDVDGFDDVVVDGESGVLYKPTSPSAVAAGIKATLSSVHYRELVAGAVRNASRFTMSASFDANLKVYEEVVQERAR